MESAHFNAIGLTIRASLEALKRIFHPQNTGMESAYRRIQITASITRDDSCVVGWGVGEEVCVRG